MFQNIASYRKRWMPSKVAIQTLTLISPPQPKKKRVENVSQNSIELGYCLDFASTWLIYLLLIWWRCRWIMSYILFKQRPQVVVCSVHESRFNCLKNQTFPNFSIDYQINNLSELWWCSLYCKLCNKVLDVEFLNFHNSWEHMFESFCCNEKQRKEELEWFQPENTNNKANKKGKTRKKEKRKKVSRI